MKQATARIGNGDVLTRFAALAYTVCLEGDSHDRTAFPLPRQQARSLERSRALARWHEAKEGWRLVDLEEERFFETDLSNLFAATELDASSQPKVEELVGDELFLMDLGLANQMQGSYRVGLQALLDGHPEYNFHLCIATAPAGRKRTRRTRAAGRYFQQLRCASIDRHADLGGIVLPSLPPVAG